MCPDINHNSNFADRPLQFGKAMLATKGPLSKEDARKNALGFQEPLAVRQPARVASPAEPPRHAPPPMRARPPATSGQGTATALYDYDGAEVDDLPVREGENVTIVEKGEKSGLCDWVRSALTVACWYSGR